MPMPNPPKPKGENPKGEKPTEGATTTVVELMRAGALHGMDARGKEHTRQAHSSACTHACNRTPLQKKPPCFPPTPADVQGLHADL